MKQARKKLVGIIFLLAIASLVVGQNFDKVKSNTKGTQINPGNIPITQINVGENSLKAGDGVTFTGKKPTFTISVDEVTITAGEGLVITGTYPNYTVEFKKHTVGEYYLGGIIFYVEDNGQHGLIAGEFHKVVPGQLLGGNQIKKK